MLHATKGIVLRTVKYGETSIVVTIYTELFGLQSYLMNGVRTDKKSGTKANLFQPTTMLDLVVYHHPHKNLQRIKEAKIFEARNSQGTDVVKYTISIYMVELIQKAITETEPNSELYHFFEESFLHVLLGKETSLANFPIAFTLSLAEHMGFTIQNNYSEQTPFFNLQNGNFVHENDSFNIYRVEKENSFIISEILNDGTKQPGITGNKRLEILNICIQYLRLHIPHLGELKSVQVLHETLN